MSFQLSQDEGTLLVHLARNAVEDYFKTRRHCVPPEGLSRRLLQPCGVFVTINTVRNEEKELRGCIGYPYPTTPLPEAVIDSAINAAVHDSRFAPLKPQELDHIVFEVSILTPPQKIEVKNPKEYITKIKVGEDGLIIERGIYKGLLLPQVPVEWEWNEEEFLCQCCNKAGLPADCWLVQGTKVYKFQCVIAQEKSPNGPVIVANPSDLRKD
jgi:uncharacterized protein (TIGR00296 family)